MIFKFFKFTQKVVYSRGLKEMLKREKPRWIKPLNDTDLPHLKVFNSLTNKKEVFKPNVSNKVEWYSCGPTVYDVSHMGHARTYISIDIIRRIMKHFLKFDIHYVMNITDVDDKIIRRARQNYLFDNYLNEESDLLEDLKEIVNHCDKILAAEKDEDKIVMLKRERESVVSLLLKGDIQRENLKDVRDAVSSWLDSKSGHTINDNSIFESLPRHFEQLFHEDMDQLNILPPDELTRVSEFIPQIIAFVEKIIDRGYGYESNGSVYFDTEKFDGSSERYYAKLVPTAFGNESLLQEGEGVLSTEAGQEKRSKNDFALWKASKAGEPSWASKWGRGRPGWHIECSAMAGDKCGPSLDIHTGGVDLKFPHHDNEIAQAEAHYGCRQWVNYFLHTGHLHIDGCKMSKSLKNFISIKEALSRYSSRQLRLAFLLSSWKDTLDYSDDLMTAACAFERTVEDFLFNARYVLQRRSAKQIAGTTSNGSLQSKLENAKKKFHEAICDSFDTPKGMAVIRGLIDDANKHYLGPGPLDVDGFIDIASLIISTLWRLGAAREPSLDHLELTTTSEARLHEVATNVISLATEFHGRLLGIGGVVDEADRAFRTFNEALIDAESIKGDDRLYLSTILIGLARMRSMVRSMALAGKLIPILIECDRLRDDRLVGVGVRLHDQCIRSMSSMAANDIDSQSIIGLYQL